MMRGFTPVLFVLMATAPTIASAQDALDVFREYYHTLRSTEEQYPDNRIQQRAQALHGLVAPPVLDSLHHELMDRADRWARAAQKADLASPDGMPACEQSSAAASSCSPSSSNSTQFRARSERQVALSQYQKVRGKIYERLAGLGLKIRKDGRPLDSTGV